MDGTVCPPGVYPRVRLRRNRQDAVTRALVAETSLEPSRLVWPLFLTEGTGAEGQPIAQLPGVNRYTLAALLPAVDEAWALGVRAVALFPFVEPQLKTEEGAEALNAANLVNRAIRALKRHLPDLLVIADVALDPYTSHGHDGLIEQGRVANDPTVAQLCRQALQQAEAGVDVVAPSDMMDGRVGALRDALDAAGFPDVRILSYAVKYASAFYGPFRHAIGSAGALKGDKRTYQMDARNVQEALREAALDIAEGADMLMVKPALAYLDVIRAVKQATQMPLFAYQVSGEYAMLQHAAAAGGLDYEAALMETLFAYRRAGADAILTYGALTAARLLRGA